MKIKLNEDDEFTKTWPNLIPSTIVLTQKDMDALLDALENPPAPNPKLVALMTGKKYQEDWVKHKYEPNLNSGIGFCNVCLSDDENDGNHII